jgi:hypothetical protein
MDPEVLLVDEPSIGLEPRYIDLVFELLGRLQREEGKTILMVEQNAKKGLEFADLGYVLVSGQLALAGTGAELLANPEVGRLFLGGSGRRSSRRAVAVPHIGIARFVPDRRLGDLQQAQRRLGEKCRHPMQRRGGMRIVVACEPQRVDAHLPGVIHDSRPQLRRDLGLLLRGLQREEITHDLDHALRRARLVEPCLPSLQGHGLRAGRSECA